MLGYESTLTTFQRVKGVRLLYQLLQHRCVA